MNTPVLFLIFNRPDHTEKVFEKIKQIKPRQLFVAADGPRKNIIADIEKCRLAREIINRIDWDCKLQILFREENLTSRFAVSSAISWFFDHVSEGIILEDDTLPDNSFFAFCEGMLDKYRDVKKMRHINGTNFLLGKTFTNRDSYYFSNYCHPWGWATWKRAWNDFDVHLTGFEEIEARKILKQISKQKEVVEFWINNLKAAQERRIDCWDFQWFYSLWIRGGLAITPFVNLVTNIGFDASATNTRYTNTRIGNMNSQSLKAIIHPKELTVNFAADEYAMQIRMKEGRGNFFQRVEAKLNLIFNLEKKKFE